MSRIEDDRIATVERKGDSPVAAFTFAPHRHRPERGRLDFDVELLDRGHEHVTPVRLTPEDGREEPHQCASADRPPLVVPGSVARDPHLRIAAAPWIPALDRG